MTRSASLHSAGYVADVAPVQHGSPDGFQAGSGQSQPSLSGQQQSSQAQVAPDNFQYFIGPGTGRSEPGPAGAPPQPGDAS